MQADALNTIEAFWDAMPRPMSNVLACGPFTIFASRAPFPFYARPTLGLPPSHVFAPSEVHAARVRLSQLGLPVAFEWSPTLAPTLADAIEAVGLPIRRVPLMLFEDPVFQDPVCQDPVFEVRRPRPLLDGSHIRFLAHDDPMLAVTRAAIDIGWSQIDTATGPAGVTERDTAAGDPKRLAYAQWRVQENLAVMAAAVDDVDGPVGGGMCVSVDAAAEITGVAVMPSHRRRGLAGELTSALAFDAQSRGCTTVFVTANDDAVAHIYARVGFCTIDVACIAEAPEPVEG